MRIAVRFSMIVVCIMFVAICIFMPHAYAKTEFIGIGTGGTGGVYYPYGGALAEVWTKHVENVRAVAEVTGASVENTKLAHKGETVIGEIMGDVAYEAYFGKGRFEGDPQNVSAMFVMYQNIYHVVTLKKSGIKTLQDMKGKKVSVGSPGSGTEYKSNLVLHAVDVPYDSIKVRRLSFVENANALRDGTIDVGIWSVGPPTSSIMDLATTHEIYPIPFSEEELDKALSEYQYYAPSHIPAGVYEGVDEDVPTVSVWNVVICNRDLSEDLVYNLVKAAFENRSYLEQVYYGAKYTTPENTANYSPIPLHPGAVKYLKEKGLEIPDRLMPE
ncbi:MAG: TAXI family TRAP transporter solute-binding subunit [Thermodesulfobacteriota bacterium]